MQQLVSAMTGTIPIGFPRRRGFSCCSHDAKKELKSTARVRSGMAVQPPGHAVIGQNPKPNRVLITARTWVAQEIFLARQISLWNLLLRVVSPIEAEARPGRSGNSHHNLRNGAEESVKGAQSAMLGFVPAGRIKGGAGPVSEVLVGMYQ